MSRGSSVDMFQVQNLQLFRLGSHGSLYRSIEKEGRQVRFFVPSISRISILHLDFSIDVKTKQRPKTVNV